MFYLIVIFYIISMIYLTGTTTSTNFRSNAVKILLVTFLLYGAGLIIPLTCHKNTIEYNIVSPITRSDNFVKVNTDQGLLFLKRSQCLFCNANNESPKLVIEYTTPTLLTKIMEPFGKSYMVYYIRYNL
jgi:hypothetical protein